MPKFRCFNTYNPQPSVSLPTFLPLKYMCSVMIRLDICPCTAICVLTLLYLWPRTANCRGRCLSANLLCSSSEMHACTCVPKAVATCLFKKLHICALKLLHICALTPLYMPLYYYIWVLTSITARKTSGAGGTHTTAYIVYGPS